MGHHGVKIFDDRKKIDFQQTIIDFQEKTILTSLIATLLEDYSVIFFLLTVCIYLHSHSNSRLQKHENKPINFKIATLAYQSLAFGQPNYLSSISTPHQPQRSLRSVNQNLLSVPHCNSSFGQKSFSYCAPKIWNDIPLSVRQSPSLDSFKRNLKTHNFANN